MIAIIMATYNGEQYLREQIDSLLKGSCRDWKLYLCDDGSTDATWQIAEEYARQYPEKFCIRKNTENLRSARNFYSGLCWAYEQEMADYYMFCDQDDCWDPDKVQVSLTRMQQLEQEHGKTMPLLVYTDSRLTDSNGEVLKTSFQAASHYRSEQCDLAHLLMENKMPGCTEMMNAALVKRALDTPDGELENFPAYFKMHDWWFGLVAAAFGKIAYVNQATMDYRQHGGNVVGGTGFASYLKNRLIGFRKQKESILENIQQGEALLNRFGTELPEQERAVLQAFCQLDKVGFFRRRQLLLQHGFWKSGLMRNVALFLLI